MKQGKENCIMKKDETPLSRVSHSYHLSFPFKSNTTSFLSFVFRPQTTASLSEEDYKDDEENYEDEEDFDEQPAVR